MVIMPDALPGLKRFLKPVGLNERLSGLVIRCVAAFVMHLGRMAAARAATAVRSEPRHRARCAAFWDGNCCAGCRQPQRCVANC